LISNNEIEDRAGTFQGGSRDNPDPVTPLGSFLLAIAMSTPYLLFTFPAHVNIYTTAHANHVLTNVHHRFLAR
jgi:hypothetical protein